MEDRFYSLLHRLPDEVQTMFFNAIPGDVYAVQEIRLNAGGHPALMVMGKLVPGEGKLTETQLTDCFFGLCGHSIHTYEEQLAEGFFTVEGGHRIGVAGGLRYENGRVVGFRWLSGLNIRISRDYFIALPERITGYLEKCWGNLLVVGPPGSGKTTLLRSIIRELQQRNLRFTVVDTRRELVPVAMGAPCYTGTRSDGILYSLRGMNPQFIVCDEIASREDILAIQQALGAGVRVIASMHGERSSFSERVQAIGMSENLFRECIFLTNSSTPGKLWEEP